MDNRVIIKSNQYGISIILDKVIPFKELLDEVIMKFKESEKFFKNAKMAVSLEGRELSNQEEIEIINAITENSSIEIVFVVDHDEEKEKLFYEKLNQQIPQQSVQQEQQEQQECQVQLEKVQDLLSVKNGQFHKGTLRSGQEIETDGTVVVMGDVNQGANVVATENIIILGALKGNAYAGHPNNESAFIVALDMDPVQMKIGTVIGRQADKTSKKAKALKKQKIEPKIAYVEEKNIYVDYLSKEIINKMKTNG